MRYTAETLQLSGILISLLDCFWWLPEH